MLLLEDDPAVRRFVQLALEPLDLDLLPCATLAEARQLFAGASVQLVLTDLTLPDGSGLEFLAWLQTHAAPSGLAYRTVVFSGGVDPAMQRQLQALKVWRVLHKPASVGCLMGCVSDALTSLEAPVPAAQPIPAIAPSDPVVEFFGGRRMLYDAYRVACLAQFPKDLDEGNRAARTGDAQTLQRVAHNLKSVLTMLGETQAAQWARSTEDCAAQRALEPMRQGWLQLRERVQQLASAQGAA